MLPRQFSFWLRVTGLVAVLLAAYALPGQSEEPSPNQQKINDIQKQLDSLTKQLAELKKTSATTATNPVSKSAADSQSDSAMPAEWVKALSWRSIGPASMGGRVVAFSVYEADPTTYWVASASGGLLKTTNNGVTFEHQFEREATVSIGDVCVAPSDKNIVWVGTGENNPRNSVSYGDGVYKSTDGGKTWKNMGLKKTFQIGKIAVHPKNPNIVYVGALGRLYGSNPDRGLYKTTDGGEHWEKIHFIDDKTGVIDMRIDPVNPETLYFATYDRQRDEFDSHVGQPGPSDGYDGYDPIRKWGSGAGLYKTSDGGKTFKKLTKGLPTSHLGRIGLDIYAKDPKTVFAIIDCAKIGMGKAPQMTQPATGGYLGIQGDNADAGVKLTQVTADGPAAKAGLKTGDIILSVDGKLVLSYDELTALLRGKKAGDKLALKISRERKGQDVTVTLGDRSASPVASAPGGRQGRAREQQPQRQGNSGVESASASRPFSFAYGGQRENVAIQGPDAHEYGGVYKSTDAGESWTRINSLNPRPMYFSQVRVDPSDDKYLYVLGISLYRSTDGGKTFKADGSNGVHPDQHALWIDPRDGRHMIVGCDGGFYVTYDRMNTWDFLNHMAIGQFYHVTVDSRRPYRVYGGLQDNSSWGGPSHTLSGNGPINEDWITISGGDGFVCRVDANDPDIVYSESQDGNIYRRNLRTGEQSNIRPGGRERMRAMATRQVSHVFANVGNPAVQANMAIPARLSIGAQQDDGLRFNWNTPFILSVHNANIFYSAGSHVYRSLKRGDELKQISPEVTRTKRGTATALAESPRNADVLYVGSDDGYIWVTKDGGTTWTNITPQSGLPGYRWVSTIEASRYTDGRAYVVFDAHRSDDDEPYVFVTEDFGATWKSLRNNLPTGSSRVCREDIVNPNLLYLGTEFNIYASLDRGGKWFKINSNLPTVAVHEVAQHPTAGEIVAATHGRSLWILDVTALRQMTSEAMKANAHLYQPNTAIRWHNEPLRGSMYGMGSRRFVGQNPPTGAQVYYSLNKKADKISMKVVDIAGRTIRELSTSSEPGLHKTSWDLRGNTGSANQGPGGGRRGGGQGGGGFGGGFGFGPPVQPGLYRIVLSINGEEQSQMVRVEGDPTLAGTIIANDDD